MLRDLPPTDAVHSDKGKLPVSEAGEHSDPKVGGVRLPYLPGLDGLRAFAVLAVLLYHAGIPWIPGGFLGVEIFFVISGYLITALLLVEWRQRGRIDLRAFWLRRARRLLPALYLLLAVTLAFAVVFLPEEVARLRGDATAAFGYVTNWYLVFGHQSYFETAGRPSLLQHLWSLAVEEQFYVLWPLLLVLGFWGAGMKRWRHRLVLLMTLTGAVASALLMAALYQPDLDPSRIYYGTDTRGSGLLIGAVLAFMWVPGWVPGPRWPGRFRRRWGWTAPLALNTAGLATFGGLVWFCLWLDESQPFLFRGGFASVALITAVLIAVVVHPRARLSASLLQWRPLRWIGLRSYGIYLWHWPVFAVSRPGLDIPLDGMPLLASRLVVTVMLAGFSYRYVETPIRNGAFGRAWRALRKARRDRRWRFGTALAGAGGVSVAFCAALGVAVVHAQPPSPPSYLSVEAVNTEASDTTSATAPGDSTSTLEKTGPATPTSETTEASENTSPTDTSADTPASAGRVTAVGDSVMVGAAEELQRAIGDNLDIDAEVGRQSPAVIDILKKRRADDKLGEIVVVHIGNNGAFNAEQIEEMMRPLENARKVVFVNVKVPRQWERPNNDVLADEVQRYPNAVLVDWHVASMNHPEFFVDDGHHLQTEGQRAYADLIAAQAKEAS